VYSASAIALISSPILTPLCFVSTFFCPIRLLGNRLMQWLFLGSIYIALCVAIFATMRSDPGRIVEWWID
jgi:hypothetical protein